MSPRSVVCSLARLLRPVTTAVVVLSITATVGAQIPGRNVNMVAGTEWPGGDPFLQRQNEPSIAASTRNSLHLLAGSNDYRTVDLPGLPDDVETGDAWVSIYKSFDGGQRWASTLMPGYPQDTSATGIASPLKGYQAAADPVVRAGTNGLVYYNGLVFDRGDNGKSGIFLARFIDRNNKENGDPIAYLGASMVATSNGTVFLDKPWMAVDLPRGNAVLCAVGGTATGGRVKRAGHRLRGNSGQTGNSGFVWVDPGLQYVDAGAIYVAYTSITGDDTAVPSTLRSEILLKRSLDCGATWSAPMRVSRSTDAINQGATIAIDPVDGDVFVAYRRFATPAAPTADAVMVARLPVGQMAFGPAGMTRALPRTDSPTAALERIFEHRKKRAQSTPAPVTSTTAQIDQGTSPYSFRTNAYPTLAIDGASRAYVAWAERGFGGARPNSTDGDARIRVATTLDAATFSAPVTVEDPKDSPTGPALPGHQLMPSLTFAGGKLLLVYYDLRETRAGVFGPFVSDQVLPLNKRQTIDIRASLGTPGATPSFAPSVRVSDYLMGFRDGDPSPGRVPEPLQVNPPNLPMFKKGTAPFIGDYIDISPAPAFVPTSGGGWAFNTLANSTLPVFHATWTDNRDVRPPLDGNWANYAPPGSAGSTSSLFDPTKTVEVCRAGNAGSRNQNIYTSRVSGGLLVGAPGNAKPLSPTVQRGFVVFAQNQTTVTRTFRMTILSQPQGAPLSGRASFEQFPRPPYTATAPPPAPLTSIYVRVPARSTASRTVYATSTDPKAQLSIDVKEVSGVGGGVITSGLADRVVLNPDIENPDIENPDIENPDIENPDIENAEVYNPDIENPDIENPDIENPDIENPDIENPDIENINVANPDIENIGVANPDIENPDIENPDIENPDIENPDIENGVISDVTWTVTNIGNTTSAFNTNVFLAAAGVPSGINTQLIVYKTYKTPVLQPNGCDLKTETRNILLFNVPSPNFITPGEGLPDQNDPSETNATLWLNPGEVGRVTLRVYDPSKNDNIIVTNLDGSTASIDPRFNPSTVVTTAISAQGVDEKDPFGATEPPAVTTTGTNLFYLEQPTNTAPGAPIAPSVRVRIWDNTGAPLPGVTVSIALLDPHPVGVLLSGTTTAVADVDGIATFTTLSVNIAATGLRLRATAISPGAVAAGTSAPFDVLLSSPVAVAIENPGFEILYKTGSTTVTALPFTSFATIVGNPSNLGMTGPSHQFSDGSFGASFDLAGWTFNTQMGVTYLGETLLGPGHGNVVWLNGNGFGGGTAGKSMSQTLSENLQQGLTYTLAADFGWRTDNGIATTPPVLNLFAGGTLLVPTAQVNPPLVQGTLVTYVRTYLVNNLSISGPLKVEVGLGPNTVGQQLNVDNVTLQKGFPGVPWTASGNGVVTLLNNGATGTPAFSYNNPGVFTGAWIFSKLATAAETVNLTYAWNGFHSYFNVTTGLDVFVNRGGMDVYVQPLVNEPLTGEGPVVCCAFPSGGFTYAGATAVSVQAGDTYGFRVRGSHGDGTFAMNGTVRAVVGGTPQFTVSVRGTAGGYENQTPGYGPSSVPARVYGGTLSAGQQVTVAASGLVQRGAAFAPNGPGGTGPGLCDGTCLLAGAPIASLLARVGGGPWQLVGAGPTTFTAASAGLLEFAVNDNVFTDNTGGFQATVVWGATATPTVTIGNWAQIYDGTPRGVSVTTVPPGLATAVTYNGSPTAPSAIGAYTVVAIAAGPGYLGRASVNETIASTVSAGGPGGGPFPASGALSCAPGVFARGVRASNTFLYGLGSGQLICSSGSDPARFVAALESAAPSYTDVTCEPGEVMVGLHGTTFSGFGFGVVSRIGAQCQSLSGGSITNAGPVGGAGGGYSGAAFSLTCDSGKAVTGVVGGAGEVVDSIALVCSLMP